MKKVLLATSLVLAATSAHAALSDTLLLRGTIAPTCSLKVTADAVSTALDLSATSAVKVGSLNVICNNSKGYVVSAASTTNGNLVETSNGTSSVPYQIEVVGKTGGGVVQPTAKGIQVASMGSTTSPANQTNDINFNPMKNTNTMAGTFQDTITFTLTTP